MKPSRLIPAVGFLAGLLYNSWPLGYWLNPSVAKIGLASDLQASGQPYSWLFIEFDVLCGLLLVVLALALIGKVRQKSAAGLAAAGLAIFGAFTAISALIPLHCHDNIRQCGYQPGQTFGWHNITGTIAALGLFFALLYCVRLLTNHRLLWLNKFLLTAWSLSGLWFLFVTLYGNYQHPRIEGWVVSSQQAFIALSGLAVWFVAYALARPSKN